MPVQADFWTRPLRLKSPFQIDNVEQRSLNY